MTSEEVIAFLNNVPGLNQTDFNFLHNQIMRWVWTFATNTEQNTIIAFQINCRTGILHSVTDGITINYWEVDKRFYIYSKILGEQPRFFADYLTPERLQEIVEENMNVQKKVYTEMNKRSRSILIDEL